MKFTKFIQNEIKFFYSSYNEIIFLYISILYHPIYEKKIYYNYYYFYLFSTEKKIDSAQKNKKDGKKKKKHK